MRHAWVVKIPPGGFRCIGFSHAECPQTNTSHSAAQRQRLHTRQPSATPGGLRQTGCGTSSPLPTTRQWATPAFAPGTPPSSGSGARSPAPLRACGRQIGPAHRCRSIRSFSGSSNCPWRCSGGHSRCRLHPADTRWIIRMRTQRHGVARPQRFNWSRLSSVLAHSSASGNGPLVRVIGFHRLASSALSGVKSCWSFGTSSSA